MNIDITNNINIRLASSNDIDAILDILHKAAVWMHENGITNQWMPGNAYKDRDYYISTIEQKQFYIASFNNESVGVFLIRWSDKDIWGEDHSRCGYIHHLAIDREFAPKGLGDQLLQWAENKIKISGKSHVRLDCISANVKLNQYYLDKGYTLIKLYQYDDGKMGKLYEKSV